VTDEQHCPPQLGHALHPADASLLELDITDCQNLVHQQDFRLEVRGNREGKRVYWPLLYRLTGVSM